MRKPPFIEVDGAEGQHAIACLSADDEHRNARAIFLRRDRHFAHTPALAAIGIKYRPAQQLGKRERGHRSESIPKCTAGCQKAFIGSWSGRCLIVKRPEDWRTTC